jgi:hypothetical protein
MPNTDVPIDPGLTAMERSPCAKCDGQMMFPGMLSRAPGFVIRKFEGTACDRRRSMGVEP